MKDFNCKLNIKSVFDFLDAYDGNGKGEDCPPCMIAPLAGVYLGELEKAGETELSERLKKVFEQGDILTIAKELDNIKLEVGEALRNELRDLDCFAQTPESQR